MTTLYQNFQCIDLKVYGSLEMEHYPKSGDPNPLVHMEIVDLSTGSITKIEEDATADMYTAWPFWTPDSKQLIFQELNRDQTHLSFYSYDIQQKSKTFLFDEKYPTWVEFHEDIWFLKIIVFDDPPFRWMVEYL